MLGKAVRIRHCPATVIGTHSGRIESLRKREDKVHVSRQAVSQETGSLTILNPVDHLEGERLMTPCLSLVRGES
jgi:hypothetical protein